MIMPENGNMYVVMFQGAKRNQCETQKNTLEKSTEWEFFERFKF